MERSSRRMLYRRGKRMLVHLLARRWRGPRRTLEPSVRRFLGRFSRRELSSLLGDRHVAMAAAAALVATGAAMAEPPVELSDVAAGTGGFVINGINFGDFSGISVSGAGDVNGDGLADLIVGADRAGIVNTGESYVVFGKAGTTPMNLSAVVCRDCADGDGNVGIVDFLALLADWGNASACDFDGGGVGINDFLELLANWGPCP